MKQNAMLNKQMNKEKNLLEVKSYKLRKYMADKVLPALGEGLLHICKNLSSDPIDALVRL